MSMFNDILCGSRDTEKECESNARLVSLFPKRFGRGQWLFLGPGSEKMWYSISADSPQGDWDRIAEMMMLEFGESKHPVFRATSPLSRGQFKNKGGGKLSIHFCADGRTVTIERFEKLRGHQQQHCGISRVPFCQTSLRIQYARTIDREVRETQT